VHFFGQNAVVTGLQQARVELPNGVVMVDDIAITNVLRPEGTSWVLVLAHPVELR
jgi:hypothetical protein